jgi:transcription elongation factor Elf1
MSAYFTCVACGGTSTVDRLVLLSSKEGVCDHCFKKINKAEIRIIKIINAYPRTFAYALQELKIDLRVNDVIQGSTTVFEELPRQYWPRPLKNGSA